MTVAASDMNHRWSRGRDRGGHRMIEGLKHILCWLRHGKLSFSPRIVRLAGSSAHRLFSEVLVGKTAR
jgi:hypothetical protein